MTASIPKKDYQTLFWVPMLFQTAAAGESIIEEMLEMISAFNENDQSVQTRSSVLINNRDNQKRRQQILGEMMDSEVKTTRVEVVTKSENSKYNIFQLHDYELEDVIDSMQESTAEEGDVIIREGESGDIFYVLEEGKCEVWINDEYIAQMDEGSSFGDLALMYNSPRAATIRAATSCVLWKLDRVFFRQAMVTSSSNQNVQLCQFLSKIQLFENLGTASLNQLARSLTKQSYDDGALIIRQGEIGEQFFVIFKGSVKCTRTGDTGEEIELVRLHEGEVFGERALIKKEPRAANVIALGNVECYYLDRNNFTLMLGGLIDRMNLINEFRILRGASIMQGLSDSRLRVLRKLLHKYTLLQGQRLLVEASNSIYIILEGQMHSDSGHKYGVGNFVGTIDDSSSHQDEGDLTTTSEEAVVMSIHKQTLLEHLASQERDGDITTDDKSMSRRNSTEFSNPRDSVMANKVICASTVLRSPQNSTFLHATLYDFAIVKALGHGTFGNVYLANHRETNKTVALKCLDKEALVKSSQQEYVRREAIALQHFSHPFIVEYFGMLTIPRKVIFLLEYIPGVELWAYLYRNPGKQAKGPYGGLDMTSVTTYAGCILLALEHIHAKGYTYRDLKPENILIGLDGFVKVVDFGFAKAVPYMHKNGQMQYRTFTLCGTPDYMAPEVVLTQGHDSSADFWAYGILIYELLCGQTPFSGSNQQRTFEKIVHSQKHLQFPPKFDVHGKSLIRRLLHPNASLRIGCLQNKCADVKEHAFFVIQNIDFIKLITKTTSVTFLPDKMDNLSGGDKSIPLLNVEEECLQVVNSEYEEHFEDLSNSYFANSAS